LTLPLVLTVLAFFEVFTLAVAVSVSLCWWSPTM
jgi:hypothetical protein